MSKRLNYVNWFAVIRVDETEHVSAHVDEIEIGGEMFTVAGPGNICVKEIVQTADEARREVKRLNELNAGKRCKYYWQSTHVFLNGGSHGETAE